MYKKHTEVIDSEMTSLVARRASSLGSGSDILDPVVIKGYVEKALKVKFDYPTRDELQKRIAITVTRPDLDSALQALEHEGKILIDDRDGTIVWIARDDEAKFLDNYVQLEK